MGDPLIRCRPDLPIPPLRAIVYERMCAIVEGQVMATETVPEQIPVARMRDDLDAVLQRARTTQQPIVVMKDGNETVVILDAAQYRREQEQIAYLQAIIEGLEDALAGRTVGMEEVEARLDAILSE
jgi:prevent-host-death family protein